MSNYHTSNHLQRPCASRAQRSLLSVQLGVMLALALALEAAPRALPLAVASAHGLPVNPDTLPLLLWSISTTGRCVAPIPSPVQKRLLPQQPACSK